MRSQKFLCIRHLQKDNVFDWQLENVDIAECEQYFMLVQHAMM